MHPILILLVGMSVVIGTIVLLRLNAFLALIGAAILVSLLAPGETAEKIARVAAAFGNTAGSIGIVIALAAIIGKAMMDSGAADRVVRAFLALLGEKRSSAALLSSGFVLAVPVFFDTVFFLLVPLARSMYTRTRRDYLKYIMAISAGGVATHTGAAHARAARDRRHARRRPRHDDPRRRRGGAAGLDRRARVLELGQPPDADRAPHGGERRAGPGARGGKLAARAGAVSCRSRCRCC